MKGGRSPVETHLIEEGIFGIRKRLSALGHFVKADPHVQFPGGQAYFYRFMDGNADEKLLRSSGEAVLHIIHYLSNSIGKRGSGIGIFRIRSKFEWKTFDRDFWGSA